MKTFNQMRDPLSPPFEQLLRALTAEPPQSPRQARRLLEWASIPPESLGPHADFEHCPSDSYGRRLIAEGPDFELLAMSWRPGDASAIHDHGVAEWGAVQVFGPAEHAVFRLTDRTLTTSKVERLVEGRILEVPPELIHQMSNPSSQPFTTLHLYGRSAGSGSVTGNARVFDVAGERILRTDGGVFFAMPPAAIRGVEPGLIADAATRARHDDHLISRLAQIRRSGISRPDLDELYDSYLPTTFEGAA